MARIAAEMVRHNVWANLRLIDALRSLDRAALEWSAPGTYGTVHATMCHIVHAERAYLRTLTGTDVAGPRNDGTDTLDELRGWAETNGAALAAFAERARPGRSVERVRAGVRHRVRVETVLTQVVHHGSDHRSQIVGILSQRGIAAPDLDGWTYGAAVLGDGQA